MPHLRAAPLHPVSIELGPSVLGVECIATLRARGLQVLERPFRDAAGSPGQVLAQIYSEMPTTTEVAKQAELVAVHASTGRPAILFVPTTRSTKGKAEEEAAALALLRARGAVVTADPEVFVECIVLLAAYGATSGPRCAIVAGPGTWLAAAARAHELRAERAGERFAPLEEEAGSLASTDVVLIDPASLPEGQRATRTQLLPVAGRPLMVAERPALMGLAASLRATTLVGRASQRIASGDGPADHTLDDDDVDLDRFDRQLEKLAARAGDHECKVLLASYGIRITRQAVATTPSAASRIAKKAGYPVEVKAWGPDHPSEADGALVIREVHTAADVRRAFSQVCSEFDCEAVIIRETPMPGREAYVAIRQVASLGLVCFLRQRGRELAAAMAPLREDDARLLSRKVIASRSDDAPPDAEALADLLVRASHLVADNERINALELGRVVIGAENEGVVVVDARAELAAR